MKKFISLTLALVMCLSVFSAVAFAAEGNVRGIASIELRTAKYYEAVHNEEEIASAAVYVKFLVNYTDGTTALYDSDEGWSDPAVTSEVSWYIKPETDENYGAQQSLYITIDGVDYWAGYVDVEVDSLKATLRNIITWDWLQDEENRACYEGFLYFLRAIFSLLYYFTGEEVFTEFDKVINVLEPGYWADLFA
ncbi:MAG: hypothetical protein IKB08_03575 [Clostridia bacterium]|nr:hypothetical protein [Clostridia bacterium]